MNLHAIASPYVGVINPPLPVSVQISAGAVTDPDGSRTPGFETPGTVTAAVAGNVLTVSAVTAGKLAAGQTLADLTTDLLPGTIITEQLTGTPGGVGTYSVNKAQSVTSESMTTSLILQGQVQALTFRDLQQISGLNLNGSRRAIYLLGDIDSVSRPQMKGGDVITFPNGSVWLVAVALETWGAAGSSDAWCKVVATLQNNA